MGETALRAIVVALVLAGAPAAAAADEGTYAPVTPREPSLAGSIVAGTCADGVPQIAYSVRAVGRDGPVGAAAIVFTDGASQLTVELTGHPSEDGTAFQGRSLWPGTVVDVDGRPIAVPGWVRTGDAWERRADGFEWTRGSVEAELRADGLALTVPLEYPDDTAGCMVADVEAIPLATTGVTLPPAVAIGGVAAIIAGAGAALLSRRRRSASGR